MNNVDQNPFLSRPKPILVVLCHSLPVLSRFPLSQVGKGTIVATKLTQEQQIVHRLHFCINEHNSEFSAEESYETADLREKDQAQRKGRQEIRACHELKGTMCTK